MPLRIGCPNIESTQKIYLGSKLLPSCTAPRMAALSRGRTPIPKVWSITATKHISVQYHFIWECIINGKIDLRLVGTNDMVADALTKCLDHVKHERFCYGLGMETFE